MDRSGGPEILFEVAKRTHVAKNHSHDVGVNIWSLAYFVLAFERRACVKVVAWYWVTLVVCVCVFVSV